MSVHEPRSRTRLAFLCTLLAGGCAGNDPPGDDSGISKMSCAELEQAYAKDLETARGCNPLIVDAEQCTEAVDTKVACGCPLLINPANAAAVDRLRRAQQVYSDRGCLVEACPAIGCVEPDRGICAVSSGNLDIGRCENLTAP